MKSWTDLSEKQKAAERRRIEQMARKSQQSGEERNSVPYASGARRNIWLHAFDMCAHDAGGPHPSDREGCAA